MTEFDPAAHQKTTLIKSHRDYAHDFQVAVCQSIEAGADVFIDYAQGIADGSCTALDIAFAHAVRNLGQNMLLDENKSPEACKAIHTARKRLNIL